MSKKKDKIKSDKESLRICNFCGASDDVPKVFKDEAYALGEFLAKNKMVLVYGAGSTGLMGASARGALENKGEVIGVFPDILKGKEPEQSGLTELIKTTSMHERKQIMYNRSSAFVIMPGGAGTMDEFWEIFTLKVLGGQDKPIIIYNFMNYWEPLLKLLQSFVRHGFARPSVADLFEVVETREELFKKLKDL